MSGLYATLDIGTTGVRVIIFELDESRRIVDSWKTNESLRNITCSDKHGKHEQDASALFEVCRKLLDSCLDLAEKTAKVSNIRGLALCNQRNSFVLLEKSTQRELTPFITWQDTRSAAYCHQLSESFKFRSIRKISRSLYSITRSPRFLAGSLIRLKPIYVPCRIRNLLDSQYEWPATGSNSEELRQLYAQGDGNLLCATVDSYCIWKLTGGESFVTDVSNQSCTGFWDPFTQKWSSVTNPALKVVPFYQGDADAHRGPGIAMPQALPCNSSFGCIDAAACGLSSRWHAIPIRAVMGDSQASVFGEGCWTKGAITLTCGTGAMCAMYTGSRALVSPQELFPVVAWSLEEREEGVKGVDGVDGVSLVEVEAESVEKRKQQQKENAKGKQPMKSPPVFLLEGSVAACGSSVEAALRWGFASNVLEFGEKATAALRNGTGSTANESETESSPNAREGSASAMTTPMVFVPAIHGLNFPHWSAGARGVLTGLAVDSTADDFCLAILNGIASRVDEITGGLKQVSGLQLPHLTCNGGVAQSGVLCGQLARMTHSEIRRSKRVDMGSIGLLMMLCLALGEFETPEEAHAHLHPGFETFAPPDVKDIQEEKKRKRAWQVAVDASLQLAKCGRHS